MKALAGLNKAFEGFNKAFKGIDKALKGLKLGRTFIRALRASITFSRA